MQRGPQLSRPRHLRSPASAPRDWTTRLRITYPGSLNRHQGVDIAVRAFARIAKELPQAEFHIYGDGPEKPALIELARSLGIDSQVQLHDAVPSDEVARIMADTDLAIEPKRATSAFGNEALSTKILEFMILGVPVVASRTRIHNYYYDDTIIHYYDDDDEAALAESILEMYRAPDATAQMVERALRYADENNWQLKKQEYLQLIDSLVSDAACGTHRVKPVGLSTRLSGAVPAPNSE